MRVPELNFLLKLWIHPPKLPKRINTLIAYSILGFLIGTFPSLLVGKFFDSHNKMVCLSTLEMKGVSNTWKIPSDIAADDQSYVPLCDRLGANNYVVGTWILSAITVVAVGFGTAELERRKAQKIDT